MKWNDLTMKERSDLMSLFLRHGIGSLSDMRHIYDGNEDTYSGGTLNSSKVSASLTRDQWNNLYRQGKVSLAEIPREYQSYIQGDPRNSGMMKAIHKGQNDVLKGLGLGIAGIAGGTAAAVAAPYIASYVAPYLTKAAPVLSHAGKVLMNPEAAKTTAGALASTAFSSYGITGGVQNLHNTINRGITDSKSLSFSDVALAGLDLTGAASGLSGITNTLKGSRTVTSLLPDRKQLASYQSTLRQLNNAEKNVPSGVKAFLDNDSGIFKYWSDYLGQSEANKLRYTVNKILEEVPEGIRQSQIENAAEFLRSAWGAYSGETRMDVLKKALLNTSINGKSVPWQEAYINGPHQYQSITKLLSKAKDIHNRNVARDAALLSEEYKELYEAAPQYLEELLDMQKSGISPEEAAKKILEQRFTFIRGVHGIDNPDIAITMPTEIQGGRADRQIFSDLGPAEDVGYLSNSVETGIAYSYPEASGKKMVVKIQRDPKTFNLSGAPKDWLLNNTLENNGIRRALSTSSLLDSGLGLAMDKASELGVTNLNFDKLGTKIFLQNLIDRYGRETGIGLDPFSHYLIRGPKGTRYKNMKITKFVNLPEGPDITVPEIQPLFEKTIVPQAVTRSHVGVYTKGHSKGAYGGLLHKYPDGGELKPATITERVGRKWDNFWWQKVRKPKDYSDEVANTPDCARWSNAELRKRGYNIWGDAWTRSNQRVKKVFSGYDGMEKPEEYSYGAYKDYVLGAADNVKKNFNWRDLEENDIVGLYFRGSPNYQKAFNKGANGEAQTHTGHVVYRKGKPYIVHNVHGDIVMNKAKKLLGRRHPYGIVSVYRPYDFGGKLNF